MSADEEEQSTFVKSMFSPANRFPSQKENFDKVNIFEIVLIKLSVITVHYFLQKCLSTVELKKNKKEVTCVSFCCLWKISGEKSFHED